MGLKRVDIFLEEGTIEHLKKFARKMDLFYSVTPSDLIRFALYKVYGIKFSSVHVSKERLEEKIQKERG